MLQNNKTVTFITNLIIIVSLETKKNLINELMY